MFGFLKKKLKEAVEKISGAANAGEAGEVRAERIDEAERIVDEKTGLREEIKEKEENIADSGYEITPEIREIVEKPAERIMKAERELKARDAGKETGEVHEELVEEYFGRTEETEKQDNAETKSEESIERKAEPESEPEEVTVEIQKSAAEEVALPEFRHEDEAMEKEPEGAAVEEIKPEKDVSQKKKSLLEKLGVRKPKKEKAELPPDFEIAGESEKKEEKEKATFFKKVRKVISEKTLEESDIKDILWDLQIGLIENDVAVGAAEKISADLKSALVGKSMPKKGIEEAVKDSMKKSVREILDAGELNLAEKAKAKKPFLAVFLGFNGVGKTTAIARVGHLLKREGFGCIFAAADTWRAGAIQQIEEHGERLGIKVIRQEYGSDPAAVIFDAKKYAEARGIDVILADTAGRSHTNANLVDELKKIVRVNKPDMKILVLDALTGNDVAEQAKYFNDAVGADAIIITKADVYEKGGSILSAAHTIKKPILYLGVGQGYKDLEKFDVEKIVNNLVE